MTDEEMLTALIHIKRHIYSKPIKKYITALEARIKTAQSRQQYREGLYQIVYKIPLYDQKNTVHVDVKV